MTTITPATAHPAFDADAAIDGIGQDLDKLIAMQTAPGVVCAAQIDDRSIVVSRGTQGAGRPMSERSRFPAGCLAKLAISILCLKLADEQVLDLEAPIGQVLPELRGLDLSLRHLLTHSSGYREPTAAAARWTWDWDGLVGHYLEAGNQVMPAGARWSYTQSGHVIVAKIIESVVGKPLELALAEHLFAPAGLRELAERLSSSGGGADDVAMHLAVYKPQRRLLPASMPNDRGVLRQSIAPWTISVPELLRLGVLIGGWSEEGQSVLSDRVRTQLATPAIASVPAWEAAIAEARPAHWTLGMGRFGTLLGHTGSYVGTSSALYIDPTKRAVVALSMNCWDNYNREKLARDVLGRIGAATIGSHRAPHVGQSLWSLTELAGDYRPMMLGAASMTIAPDGQIVGGIKGQLSIDEDGALQIAGAGFAASLGVLPHPLTGAPAFASAYSLYTREPAA